MTGQFLQGYKFNQHSRLMGVLSFTFVFIVAITIFQDFLESSRRGYSFYFSESLLFKAIWFLFIPILALLYEVLKKRTRYTISQMGVAIITPICVHFVLVLVVVWALSAVFFDYRYGFDKMFAYTLGNDLYKLVLVYGTFVFSYRYIVISSLRESNVNIENGQFLSLQHIVVNNGKENFIVKVSDIVLITAATPYVALHLEDKRYLHTETLKALADKLDSRKFVRTHKSAIVNIDKVVSYKSRLNGDYDLVLQHGEEIRLSRTYVAAFKALFCLLSTKVELHSNL